MPFMTDIQFTTLKKNHKIPKTNPKLQFNEYSKFGANLGKSATDIMGQEY